MKVHFRIGDLIVTGLCYIAVITMIVYFLITKNTLPAEIPSRYDFSGNIRAYGSRNILLTAPVSLLFLISVLSVVSLFPSMWNLPGVKLTEENSGRLTGIVRTMLDIMLVLITAMFLTIYICQLRCTLVPAFLLPILCALFVANIIFCIMRCIRAA